MHKVEFSNRNISIEVPEHWNEMNSAQVEYIFSMMPLLSCDKLSVTDFKVRVVLHFIPVRISARAIARQLRGRGGELAESVIWLYDTLFGYLLVNVDDTYILNYNSPIQFFPTINNVQGPGSLLQGMTYGDFITACAIMEHIDTFGFDELVRHLYAGINTTSVPEWKKAWVAMWFRSCVGQIQGDGVCIDGRHVRFSVLFGSGDSKPSRRSPGRNSGVDPWRSALFVVAESGAFGDVEGVKRTDLYEVLMYLIKMYNDAKDRKY